MLSDTREGRGGLQGQQNVYGALDLKAAASPSSIVQMLSGLRRPAHRLRSRGLTPASESQRRQCQLHRDSNRQLSPSTPSQARAAAAPAPGNMIRVLGP